MMHKKETQHQYISVRPKRKLINLTIQQSLTGTQQTFCIQYYRLLSQNLLH